MLTMPSRPPPPVDPIQAAHPDWAPLQLWDQVEQKAAAAVEESPDEAGRLVYEFVNPETMSPFGDLLRALHRSSPERNWALYVEKGGPDPLLAPPLAVLEGMLNLFVPWCPDGGEYETRSGTTPTPDEPAEPAGTGAEGTTGPGRPILAPVATKPERVRTVFRLKLGVTEEAKKAIASLLKEHPGATLRFLQPGEALHEEAGEAERGPAFFHVQSWREDNHECPSCDKPFFVAYGNPPDQAVDRHNVVVRCPGCGRDVAVAVPSDVSVEDIHVGG